MLTKAEERQINRIVRYIAFGIPLMLIMLGISDSAFHRLFYTKTTARVLSSETKLVGSTATQYGTFGIGSTIIEVEYTDSEGCIYTAKLPASNRGYIGVGYMVPIIYKN
jgi:hypothetical protein